MSSSTHHQVIDHDDANRPLLDRLQDAFSLPNALARTAQYIIENPEKVMHLSQVELSVRAQTGQASIQRLCKRLGFHGYRDFKIALAGEIGSTLQASEASRKEGKDDLSALGALVSRSIEDTVDLLDDEQLSVVAIRLCEVERVHVFGSGMSGLAAEIFAYRLLREGINASCIRDINIAREISDIHMQGGAAIGISQSGVSPDTIEFIQTASDSGAFTVAVTCSPEAELARLAHVRLFMARLSGVIYGGHVIDFPRVSLVAEALGRAVAIEKQAQLGSDG